MEMSPRCSWLIALLHEYARIAELAKIASGIWAWLLLLLFSLRSRRGRDHPELNGIESGIAKPSLPFFPGKL